MNRSKPGHLAIRGALIYIFAAALWIWLSDELLAMWVGDPGKRVFLSILKGWGFILVTGALLYLTLARLFKKQDQEKVQREETDAIRQQAWEKLRQSEEQLRVVLQNSAQTHRLLVENMSNGLMVCEVICDESGRPRDHRFVQGNPALEKLTGMSLKNLAGKTSQDLPIKCPPALTQSLYKVAQNGEPIEYSQYHENLGCHFEVRVFSPRYGQFAQVFLDITERMRTAAAMRASERRFRTVLETMSLIGVMLDRQGKITLCNDALLELTGWKREEVLHQNWFDLFIPAGVTERIMQPFSLAAIANGEFPAHCENEIVTRQAERRLIVWNNTVLRDEDESILGLACIGQDVTERRRIEKSHARLATAVEQAAESILLTDLQGKILYVNPAFEKITGYSRAEVIGQTPRLLKSGKHDAEFYRRLWDTLGRGEIWEGHLINRRKDGALYDEAGTISPVRDMAGTIINYAAIRRDVTQDRQMARQTHATQKMEAFEQLAGDVAHDFNNILATLMIQTDLLEMIDALPDEVREGLRHIRADGQRAANLTRELLLFSRRERMLPSRLNASDIVVNATRMLKRGIRENIELQLRLAPVPLWIHADPGMIEQVLMTLARNASDAMPQGGRLLIETTEEHLNEKDAGSLANFPPGRYVCLRVSDTGKGIAEEVLPKIFEPFFTTKKAGSGSGSGLGLAKVFGIIKQHHGCITVASEPGQGATFRIILPGYTEAAWPANPGTPSLMAPQKSPGGTGTILLVEDESPLRSLCHNLLAHHGYQVVEAASGEAALRRWQELKGAVSLLFTDIMMPGGMDGVELARRLRLENPNLKVVFTSGHNLDMDGREFQLSSPENFVAKPCSAEQLLNTVRRVLQEKV